MNNENQHSTDKNINTDEASFENITTISECMRDWEPYHKRGFDPNETRMLDIFECWTGEIGPAIGLVGIPFDSAVIGRKGAKGGPKKIRDSIRYFKAYSWFLDYWFGDKKIYDFGDVIINEDSIEASHEIISTVIKKIASKGFVPITLGGDHSIGYPLLKGIKEAYPNKKIGLINIDAHLDVRELIEGKINSGTPFRRILENELINGENFVEIGIRDFANAKKYRDYVESKNATIFTMNDIRKQGFSEIIRQSLAIISKNIDITYLSVDMDSLDQIYAPGVSAPTPDGLTPNNINQLIHEMVTSTSIVGMDIVELNPLYDTADTTAINAANFVTQFVASYYWKQNKKNK
ncbi:MAG: formimidoylglutamase [Candidatus Thorarchaeota archaeon]